MRLIRRFPEDVHIARAHSVVGLTLWLNQYKESFGMVQHAARLSASGNLCKPPTGLR